MPPEAPMMNLACDECRTRKYKCSKERPSCLFCLEHRKECRYSQRASRTPLTRENLTSTENRLRQLETVLMKLLPGVDLNTVQESLPSLEPNALDRIGHVLAQNVAPPPQSSLNAEVIGSNETSEALPSEADGFDWAETGITFGELSDGMAALSIKPEGTGYFGATSSVVPLRTLLPRASESDSSTQMQPYQFAASSASMASQVLTFNFSLSNMTEQNLVDAYFHYYHSSYPFLHEATFRDQLAQRIPRPKGRAWPILLNTVLAFGAWVLGDDTSTLDDMFYREVKRLTLDTSVFEVGNLAVAQALLLLSNYTQKCDRPNTGWNYLGLAVRMALSLGLHKEFSEWKISPLEREVRRRVWWGVYIFDCGASITFGRPILLPQNNIMDANHVLNVAEELLTPETTSPPLEVCELTVFSGLIAQIKFHLATNDLYHRLISSSQLSPQERLDLQKPIDEWEASIPDYFQFSAPGLHTNAAYLLARYRLSWRAWNLRIILFRPIVLRWAVGRWSSCLPTDLEDASETECRMACLRSARDTISSVSEFVATNACSRLGAWYMLYFLFQASLIPAIFLVTDPMSPDASSWISDLRLTKELLSYGFLSKGLAGRCMKIIDRLCSPLFDVPDPETMLQNPKLFTNAHSMLSNNQVDGMEFFDWSSFGL